MSSTQEFSSGNPGGPVKLEPPAPAELQAQLPAYEVSQMIGRGGMGAVYLGRQISLDREVAIKILPQHLEGEDGNFVERFKNEARAMAKLNHPGIVSVYDFGWTETGLLYFVMEFIEGTDVQRMISQQKRLKSKHAHAITAHVCDALAYAHERGLIHRDIKPANIMIGRDGEVKVADFGLAKAMDANVSNLTQSGLLLGTLHYMAPECFILGAAVDHRADIYAVGVMLYQMLSGRLPQGVFKLPSEQVEGLDPRFDAIIAKAMREEREQRYQSARELRQDLDDLLTQPIPVKSAPETTTTAPPARQTRVEEPDDVFDAESPLPRPRLAWGWLVPPALVLLGVAVMAWKMISIEPPAPPVVTAPAPAPVITPALPAPAKKSAVASAPVTPPVAIPRMDPVPTPEPQVTLDFPEYAQLLQTHAADWQTRVQKTYDDGLAALRANCLAALRREHTAAQRRADKKAASAFAVELEWFQRTFAPPASDDPILPPRIAQIRQIFRAELQRLEKTKETVGSGVRTAFIESLTGLQKNLETATRTGQARAIQELHGSLVKSAAAVETLLASQKILLPPPVSVTQPVASAPSAGTPAPASGAAGRIVAFEDTFDTPLLSAEWKQQANAWHSVGGALSTSKPYLQAAGDKGYGCWMVRDLPEQVRVEFDVNFLEEDSVLSCELFSKPRDTALSGVVGYRFVIGDKKEPRPLIYRGMTQLSTDSEPPLPGGKSSSTGSKHVAIERTGNTIVWEVDGKPHATATDPTPLREGRLAFQLQAGTVLIDNLTVQDIAAGRQPVVAKPATSTSAVGTYMLTGHVLNHLGKLAANSIVRVLDVGYTQTDELGRFAIRGIPSGTHDIQAEGPGGVRQTKLYARGGQKVLFHELEMQKTDTVGIRWVLQTQAGNKRLEGAGTENGMAYISSANSSFDLRRGTKFDASDRQQKHDFRLYISGRKVTFYRDTSSSEGGWHKEDLPFDQIVELNHGKPVSDRDYFVQNGLPSGTVIRVGEVFTARCVISGTYAKIEIIHMPD